MGGTGMTKEKFFWGLLLMASSIAAVVSFLTTSFGLERYIPGILSWLLSFAVQASLFGLAWLMGASLRRLKVLVVLLYCLTMPFSVVFSYVTLQSEFSKNIKPRESQRALFDHTRQNISLVRAEVSEASDITGDVMLRLDSWLEMERRVGWATQTCEQEQNCYLAQACWRIRDKIKAWERANNLVYREGPGEQLIFGFLETELQSARRLGERLDGFQKSLSTEGLLDASINNRERLARYDTLLGTAPRKDIESMLCRPAELPPAPAFEDYARDDAVSEEQPVYAFEDLLVLFEANRGVTRADYPTVFALLLAGFVDFFVLLVAIGASLISLREVDVHNKYPGVQPVPSSWDAEVERDIETWVDGSLLKRSADDEERLIFLKKVVDSIRIGREGQIFLVPENVEQQRFCHWLLKSRAASQKSFTTMEDGSRCPVFFLEDWVYPALMQFFRNKNFQPGGDEDEQVLYL